MTEEATTITPIKSYAQLKALVNFEYPDVDDPSASVTDTEMAEILVRLWDNHAESYPETKAKKPSSPVFIQALGSPSHRDQLIEDLGTILDDMADAESTDAVNPEPMPTEPTDDPAPEPVEPESNEDPIYDIFGQKFTSPKAYRARVRAWCRAKANQYTWETHNKVYTIDRSTHDLPVAYIWLDPETMTLEYTTDPDATPAPAKAAVSKAVEATHDEIDDLLSE